jgi:hypothetical protein
LTESPRYASPIDGTVGHDYVNNTYRAAVNFSGNEAIADGGGLAGGGGVASYGNVLTDQGSRFINNLVESIGGSAFGGGLLKDNVSSGFDVPCIPFATLISTVFSGNMAIGVNVPAGPGKATAAASPS